MLIYEGKCGIKIKVKLPLYTPRDIGKAEVKLHSFLTWSDTHKTPGTSWTEGCISPKSGIGFRKREKWIAPRILGYPPRSLGAMLFPLLNNKLNAVLCFVKCKQSMFCSTTLTSLFQFIRSNDPYVPRFHDNELFSVDFSNAFLTTPFTSSGSFRTQCRSHASFVPDKFIPNRHNSRDTQIPGARLFWHLISGGLQSVTRSGAY